MSCILNLSQGVRALLLFFAWSAVAQDAERNGAPKSRIASGVSTNHDYWAVEDAKAREKLPLYKIIPAAKPEELTPANGYPKPETFQTWHRSHGDNGGMRYSALDQINRTNVAKLQQAWIYHSRDGNNNLQCNPIVVRGVMIAPTAGKFMVGIDAEKGNELWRFKPEGQPAFRGLVYWEARRSPTRTGTKNQIEDKDEDEDEDESVANRKPVSVTADMRRRTAELAQERILFCAG